MEAISAVEAVGALIAHVREHEINRQKAKDAGQRSYKPTNEEKAERDRLLRGMIWSLQLTRHEILAKLQIDRATWDRWRMMKTIPQSVHRDGLTRLAAGGVLPPTANGNPLIQEATQPMLAILGITKEQLEQLEWLERMQRTAGIPLTESSCRVLLEEFQAAHSEQPS